MVEFKVYLEERRDFGSIIFKFEKKEIIYES